MSVITMISFNIVPSTIQFNGHFIHQTVRYSPYSSRRCCSIFSQSYVFFQGCPCPLLDVIYLLHPGALLLLFPSIIPIMHVYTRLHLVFLRACPKKVIFLLIISARSSRLVLKFIQYALVQWRIVGSRGPGARHSVGPYAMVRPNICQLGGAGRHSVGSGALPRGQRHFGNNILKIG